MNQQALKNRLDEIAVEASKATVANSEGRLESKRYHGIVSKLASEADAIRKSLSNIEAAKKIAAAQDVAFGMPTVQNKMIGPVRSQPPSPMDLTPDQIGQLYRAAETKTPLTLEIRSKAYSPVTEYSPSGASNITGGIGQLPPIIVPNRFMSLPYEPSRVSQYLPSAAMDGPSAVWLTHTANAQEAATVGEAGPKMDIGPTVIETQVKPTKIAGLVSVSLEAWQDYGEFGEWLPTELTRSLINSESNLLLNAGTSGGPQATFPGLLATSGTLTRAVGTDTPLDALNKSFVDVRVGPAYAEPDLVITHPETIAAMRREKDASGRYILDLFAGPLALTADGAPRAAAPPDANLGGVIPQGTNTTVQSIWGVPVVETTQCPPGTAVVMSVRAGAALFYVRLGMLLQFNMFGDAEWQNNLFSWRVEERIALATPRPEAINILTGLPTS
ncbi:phage major capsid protein [Mycobacterium sp.]|uniref:phage major capsid protein n=1 Tax=Mycobacterium sp. TaxID=1785 RepID=UPI0031DE1305